MQRLTVALIVLFFISAGLAQGEKTFEPEFFSVFYYLDPSDKAVELERQIPKEAGLKGGKMTYVVPGEKSPVRLNGDSKMQFVVRVTEDFDKATATMQLFRYEVQNGMRQLALKKSDVMTNSGGLRVNVEKYGRSSLKLSPAQELTTGEYCLTRTTISQGFCFGIDGAGSQKALR